MLQNSFWLGGSECPVPVTRNGPVSTVHQMFGRSFHSFINQFHMLSHPTATLPHSRQGSSLFGHTGILHLLLHVDKYNDMSAVSIWSACFHTVMYITMQIFDFDVFM